jgi:hypothetical protein
MLYRFAHMIVFLCSVFRSEDCQEACCQPGAQGDNKSGTEVACEDACCVDDATTTNAPSTEEKAKKLAEAPETDVASV